MRPLVYGKRHSQEIIFKYAGYASAWSTTGISTKPYITTGYYVQQSASVEVQYFWKSTHYSITHAILRSKVQCVKAHSDEIKLRFTHRSAGLSPLRASPKHGRFREVNSSWEWKRTLGGVPARPSVPMRLRVKPWPSHNVRACVRICVRTDALPDSFPHLNSS